jgi:hypothetical protein
LSDPEADFHDILNFELYPWHSKGLTAEIDTPPDLVERYVFDAIAEIGVPNVFAFGAPWFAVCEKLAAANKLKPTKRPHKPLGDSDSSSWTVGLYELRSKQVLAVSAQLGYAGPPGKPRIEIFRHLVGVAGGP